MECPFCAAPGSEIRYIPLMSMTGYQCGRCGQKWMEMGKPRFEVGRERAQAEYFAASMTYAAHGVVVWLVFFLGYFFLCFSRPLESMAAMSPAVGGMLLVLAAATGLLLGWILLGILNFTGRWVPGWKAAHTIGPLAGGAWIGGTFSLVLSELCSGPWRGMLAMHDLRVCVALGAVMALMATPIIIVRSSARLRREGFRSAPRSTKDQRWDC